MKKKIFGRKKGYPLKLEKQKQFNQVFPQLRLNIEDNTYNDVILEFPSKVDTIYLEVGFGSGEHIKWQLENNINIGFFCCDPYINGVANLIASLDKKLHSRIKIMMDDAEILLDWLPAKSISKIFILFPDPWDKKKHFKRRFINHNTIFKISKILKDSGEIRIATDSSSYLGWIFHYFLNSKHFIWKAKSKKDFLYKPIDWPPTRYEKKAVITGKHPIFLIFKKIKNKQY